MEKVKALLGSGARFPSAVKEALADVGLTVDAFAEKHGEQRVSMSRTLNLRQVPTAPQLGALSAELGGTPQEWLDLWWEAARAASAANAAGAAAG